MGNVTLRRRRPEGSGSEALLTAAGLIHKLPFHATWPDFTSGPPMLAGHEGRRGRHRRGRQLAAGVRRRGRQQITIVGALTSPAARRGDRRAEELADHSVADLKGKKIAVAQGSSANYHLLAVLQKAGLSVKDVTLEYLQPAEGQAALSSGAVDAWAIWEPVHRGGGGRGSE